MFIIHSGWGELALIIPFLLVIVCLFLGQYWPVKPGEGETKTYLTFAVALSLSAPPVWILGRRMNRRGNGEYSTEHSMYSIPLQYWGVIWAAVSVFLITWRFVR